MFGDLGTELKEHRFDLPPGVKGIRSKGDFVCNAAHNVHPPKGTAGVP